MKGREGAGRSGEGMVFPRGRGGFLEAGSRIVEDMTPRKPIENAFLISHEKTVVKKIL